MKLIKSRNFEKFQTSVVLSQINIVNGILYFSKQVELRISLRNVKSDDVRGWWCCRIQDFSTTLTLFKMWEESYLWAVWAQRDSWKANGTQAGQWVQLMMQTRGGDMETNIHLTQLPFSNCKLPNQIQTNTWDDWGHIWPSGWLDGPTTAPIGCTFLSAVSGIRWRAIKTENLHITPRKIILLVDEYFNNILFNKSLKILKIIVNEFHPVF